MKCLDVLKNHHSVYTILNDCKGARIDRSLLQTLFQCLEDNGHFVIKKISILLDGLHATYAMRILDFHDGNIDGLQRLMQHGDERLVQKALLLLQEHNQLDRLWSHHQGNRSIFERLLMDKPEQAVVVFACCPEDYRKDVLEHVSGEVLDSLPDVQDRLYALAGASLGGPRP